MKNAAEFCPKSKKEWRAWLELNHEIKDAVWLVFHKKNTPNFNLSWSDSVDEALCFGWIDSTKKSMDDLRFKQYFSKRKPRSNWSKVNKEKVKILIEQGLMMKSGYKSIEIAKENGSWTILDSVENLEMPTALAQAFNANQNALIYFDNLCKSEKKALLYWVISAKREATRTKRINEIVKNASKQMKPEQFR